MSNSLAGRWLRRLIAAQRTICEALIILMTLLIVTEGVCRGIFSTSLLITEELAGYFLLGLTFFGMGVARGENALFRVAFLYDALGATYRSVFNVIFDIVGLICSAILVWQFSRLVSLSYARGAIAPTVLGTPLYIPQAVMAAGAIGMLLIFLLSLADAFSKRAQP